MADKPANNAWKASVAKVPTAAPAPKTTTQVDDDDDWDTGADFINDVSEKESRWGSKSVPETMGAKGAVHDDEDMNLAAIRQKVEEKDKVERLEQYRQTSNFSRGYGGEFDLLNERSLIQTESASSLTGTRLGIDANTWLRKLIQTLRDNALTGLGATIPFHLGPMIDTELQWFRTHRIQPVFVFPGLNLRRDRPFTGEDTRIGKRQAAWEKYALGQTNSALGMWATAAPPLSDVFPYLMQKLHEQGVEYLRAPYSSWGQLTYMVNHPMQLVHAVYAGSDLLMFDVDRVITGIDQDRNSFTWVDKNQVAAKIGLSKDQFLDCCILAGFDWINTYKPLTNDPSVPFNWVMLAELFRHVHTGVNLIHNIGDQRDKPSYLEQYSRVRCAIKHHLVLTTNGAVEPLNKPQAPSDLHDVFGPRLPDRVYWALTQCLVSPPLLQPVLTGTVPEFSPMCNGETIEYQNMLASLLRVRAWTADVVNKDLPPALRGRRMAAVYWNQPNVEHPIVPDATASSLRWCVDKLPGLDAGTKIDFVACLRAVAQATPEQVSATVGPTPANMTPTQVLADVHCRILELCGYLDSSHRPTASGRAYLVSATRPHDVRGAGTTFHDDLFVAAEMLRLGVFHDQPYSKAYHADPITDPQVRAHVLLLCRVACCLEPACKPQPWQGALNRDLLVCASFMKLTTRTLRTLAESLALHTASGDLASLSLGLPFACIKGGAGAKSAAMGVLVREFLVAVAQGTEPARAQTLAAHKCASVADVAHELDRFRAFLDSVVSLVKHLQRAGLLPDPIAHQFETAAAWVAPVWRGAAPAAAVGVTSERAVSVAAEPASVAVTSEHLAQAPASVPAPVAAPAAFSPAKAIPVPLPIPAVAPVAAPAPIPAAMPLPGVPTGPVPVPVGVPHGQYMGGPRKGAGRGGRKGRK
ncbi:hypothetical protein GGF32_000486 [Allomyces javanicus]|nr:hypothetical protein GGF32_000486 [Allomyces javanicus]